jgi:acyl-CoA thioester hydrolase
MDDNPPQVRIEIPLRHRDIDALGHVNQAVFHVLLEEVRSTFIRESLPDLAFTGYVLARSELDYRRELVIADRYVIGEARLGRVGSSSITVENRLLKADGLVAAEGLAILVVWDEEKRRSRRLSDEERAMIARGS